MPVEIIDPGLATSVQDLGRQGHYNVGIPPSGALCSATDTRDDSWRHAQALQSFRDQERGAGGQRDGGLFDGECPREAVAAHV